MPMRKPRHASWNGWPQPRPRRDQAAVEAALAEVARVGRVERRKPHAGDDRGRTGARHDGRDHQRAGPGLRPLHRDAGDLSDDRRRRRTHHPHRHAPQAGASHLRRGERLRRRVAAGPRSGSRPPIVLGITGPPGSGKSTITDRLIEAIRARNQTVAVVAVDPSSPFTHGAVLGDRVRMQRHAGDAGVFIRSMASREAGGGLAPARAKRSR